ncbi:MAG: hypothetical protein IJV01_08420 [Bacteroidales bacterium]|nr:hypothetical protein [Bacteroidales bacterium]
MRFKTAFLLLAALVPLAACVGTSEGLGGSLIPVSRTYKVVTPDPIDLDVDMKMADKLSGYSSTRITVGAIRDDEFGLTTRSCALVLVPLKNRDEKLDFGTNPVFKSFHFSAIADSVSVSNKDDAGILQNVRVYELSKALKVDQDYDCNKDVAHNADLICRHIPVINGTDSLAFDFTAAFAEKYVHITDDDLSDFSTYQDKYPGIYIETDVPAGNGGRINIFQLQLGYDSGNNAITGSVAMLKFRSDYGTRTGVDTTFYFYFSPTGFHDADSLFANCATGNFPQYALNLTGHDAAKSRAREGAATAEILLEGGGGLKPVVSAVKLKQLVSNAIAAAGDDPSKVTVNRASLILSYKAPDARFEEMYKLPAILSPTCKITDDDGVVKFMGLTDASSEEENQGDINRSLMQFAPDITYHMQEILRAKDDDKNLLAGNYDIWFLIMSQEKTTTTTAANSELSDYYTALAYQSYYNNMYGGYGGYGGAYGGYGYGDYYTNYYSYMMAASYASGSSTSTQITTQLDKDRFYCTRFYGPAEANPDLRPKVRITYSVSK